MTDVDMAPVDMSVLSATHMRCGLSQLGHTLDGYGIAFVKATLRNLGLRDVAILERYAHLNEVDVSQNALEDISPIRKLFGLVTFRCTHNVLTSALPSLQPCVNIQLLDLSHNKFTSVENFRELKFLHTLNLSHNHIKEIAGLSGLAALRNLDLSHNEIAVAAGMDGCGLHTLRLHHNAVSDLGGLRELRDLEMLDIDDNEVMDLSPIASLAHLNTLSLCHNNVHDAGQLQHLKKQLLLRFLSVEGNPMYAHYSADYDPDVAPSNDGLEVVRGDEPHGMATGRPVEVTAADPIVLVPEEEDVAIKSSLSVKQLFRLKVLWYVPQVWRLDGEDVTVDEKTASTNLEGGEDHGARRKAHLRFFGDKGDGTHILKKVPKPVKAK